MLNFKRNSLSLAVLLSIGAMSSPIVAQEVAPSTSEADGNIEEVIVSGFRRSLVNALDQKRFADTISEQLSADDLGGLPDVSMADALTRLPGISAVRTGGQAAEINIRGMSGGFVFSTLNGREQVSTSGSRSIEFDQYPSELISSAAVYKSPKASMIEGGVAGSVELGTASPLSNSQDHSFSANVRGMFNDRASEVFGAEEYGSRTSFSYQGKFLDETFGVALGYARLYQPHVSTQFIGLAYNVVRDVDNIDGDSDGPDSNPQGELLSEGMELQHKGGEETRDGYVAAIEWEPNDVMTFKADAFISKFDSEAFARGFRVKFEGNSASIANPVLDDNYLIGATVNRRSNGYTRVELVNDDNRDYDELKNYGANLDLQVTERLNFNFDFAMSKAESDFRNGLLWSLVSEDANAETPVLDTDISISYQLNGLNLPDVGFSQADAFSDIDRVLVSKYGIYPYVNSDEQKAVRFDLSYELEMPFLRSFESGLRWSERTYANTRSVFEYGNDSNFSAVEPPLRLSDAMTTVVDWEGDYSYFPSYLAIDLDMALDAWFPNGVPQPATTWGAGNPNVVNADPNSTKSYDWTMLQTGEVYEDIFAAYAMFNIESEVFGLPLTGNFGVRWIDTEQRATSLENVGGDPLLGAQYIEDSLGYVNDQYASSIKGIKYSDVLPQFNLNFALTENDQLRFAAAKVMSRPPINRLASDTSFTISDTGRLDGNSSNSPGLKPFYATQFDLSYEHYFEQTEGALAIALFYKDIESSGIVTTTFAEFDFRANGFAVPETYIDETSGVPQPISNGNYTVAFNDQNGGYIQGAEFAYTQVFNFLPEPFDGLGVNLSYSYTDSEIEKERALGSATVKQTLEGLSRNVMSSTVFWEWRDFETRLSVRSRDKFVSDQVAIDTQTVFYAGETVIDYQASYQVTENLGLLFQVNNLTDEPTRSYFASENQTGTIQYFGRQFFLGLTFTY